MPCTLDAAALTQMNRRGQNQDCIVDGPFALDNAVSEESARPRARLAGPPDRRRHDRPEYRRGQHDGQALVTYSKNETAGLILGATAPVVLTSRADLRGEAAFRRRRRALSAFQKK
jgi:phosphate butyryltransferase